MGKDKGSKSGKDGKKGADKKGSKGGEESDKKTTKVKGAQKIKVRHILVSLHGRYDCGESHMFSFLYLSLDSARNNPRAIRPWRG